MGRLFWKFFFFIWLAQLTTIVGVSITFWLEHRAMDTKQAGIDRSPPAGFFVETAAATLRYGGTPALRGLLGDVTQPKVYAVDEKNRELLGRNVEPTMIEQVRQALEAAPSPHAIRKVNGADGHAYLLFLPLPGNRPTTAPPPGDRCPDGNGPPLGGKPPHPGEHHIPIEPIVAAMLASLIFAALLAWYFSKPIRNLHSAFEAAATGNLSVRLGPAMGKRRDELADLGRDFDRMASHLFALMDGQRRLLHDVSHELRSPLARLQAAIGLARQQPEKLEAFLARIEREGVRMDKLVGELLTLSRLEAGVTGSMEEEINLEELIAGVVNDARFEAEARGRTVALSGGGESVVKGNAELLHRAIENVIRNAVKHTPDGGSVTVDVQLDAQGRNLHVSIADQGPGIPKGDLSEIFEPFFRGNEMTNSTDGHGLGLAISRRVAEAHGGTIRASNLVGGGLCVEIALPVNLSSGND